MYSHTPNLALFDPELIAAIQAYEHHQEARFDCDYANVQTHSSAQANAAIFLALISPDALHAD